MEEAAHPHTERYVMFSIACYFGWLLSFPFYGPLLATESVVQSAEGFNWGIIFIACHALSFFIGGFFLKQIHIWKQLMTLGLAVTLAIHLSLFLLDPNLWGYSMVVLGMSSSMFIMGWSCVFSLYISSVNRIKWMAAAMIIANVIFVMINILSDFLPSLVMLGVVALPLLGAAATLRYIPGGLPLTSKANLRQLPPLPVPLIVILCLFVLGLYLNGGFMYNIMLPYFGKGLPYFSLYRYLPYILVLLVMVRFGGRVRPYFPIYMGVTLLGMGFVSFALIADHFVGIGLTLTLVEAAFAFLDLFVWVVMGELAFIYGRPYQFFGFISGAMVFSILAGDFIGEHLLMVGETHRLVTAIFAAATIFLTYLITPWLFEKINHDFTKTILSEKETAVTSSDEDLLTALLQHLHSGYNLTPREVEITELILKGLKNKDIAEQLFISDNTLKSHLKNIYPKFGVTQKRELLSMALSTKNSDSS